MKIDCRKVDASNERGKTVRKPEWFQNEKKLLAEKKTEIAEERKKRAKKKQPEYVEIKRSLCARKR